MKMKLFDVYDGPREITEECGNVRMEQLTGNASQISENLKQIEDDVIARGYTSVKFKTEYYGYDGGFEMQIFGIRDETEEETKKRVDKNLKARDTYRKKKAEADLKKEQRERKELARLQKKFKQK